MVFITYLWTVSMNRGDDIAMYAGEIYFVFNMEGTASICRLWKLMELNVSYRDKIVIFFLGSFNHG